MEKSKVNSSLLSIALMIMSLFLFTVSEVIDSLALPSLSASLNFNFMCIRERWQSVEVLRSTQGVRLVFSRDFNGMGNTIAMTPGMLGLGGALGQSTDARFVSVVTPINMGISEDRFTNGDPDPRIYTGGRAPITWPVAIASGTVLRWRAEGVARLIKFRTDTTGQMPSTAPYMGDVCLPGWDAQGNPLGAYDFGEGSSNVAGARQVYAP